MVATSADPTSVVGPSQERIPAIDVVRGVAVLGILMLNILGFGLPWAAYLNPAAYGGDTGLNLGYWYAQIILFEGKMRAVFSMLFGASVILMTAREDRREAGLHVADIYYRRTLWLLVIGLCHTVFLTQGDILFSYGMAGLALYPFRKMRPWTLAVLGTILLMVPSINALRDFRADYRRAQRAAVARELETQGHVLSAEERADQERWTRHLEGMRPDTAKISYDLARHRSGYWAQLKERRDAIPEEHFKSFYRENLFDVGGMMLVGMALMMWGVVTAERADSFYLALIVLGFGVGISLNTMAAWLMKQGHFESYQGAAAFDITVAPGRLAVGLGYVGVVMLMVKRGWLRWLTARLAAVGKMALTNYLLTSLLCTLFFNGYGLNFYGRLERYQLLYVVLGVWAVLLLWSPLWLERFRFGPMEWLWRSLTRWRPQPMVIRRASRIDHDADANPA